MDPVSYGDGRPVQGSAYITARHDGIRYGFFWPHPGRHLPRYCGWCAYGQEMDEAESGVAHAGDPVDPKSYGISGGELYLSYRSPLIDGRKLWRRDPERHRRRADETWRRLRRR